MNPETKYGIKPEILSGYVSHREIGFDTLAVTMCIVGQNRIIEKLPNCFDREKMGHAKPESLTRAVFYHVERQEAGVPYEFEACLELPQIRHHGFIHYLKAGGDFRLFEKIFCKEYSKANNFINYPVRSIAEFIVHRTKPLKKPARRGRPKKLVIERS